MVSRWKSCEGRVWKRTAKSEFWILISSALHNFLPLTPHNYFDSSLFYLTHPYKTGIWKLINSYSLLLNTLLYKNNMHFTNN
jgi:hypothetical protein